MTTRAEQEIRLRIAKRGKITFAEFMELALYHPVDGYYAGERIGAEGDYYTSSIVHPAFGALICIQLHAMWEALGRPSQFHAVEVGAGTGLLARDIVEYSRHLPGGFRDALRYVAVDRTPSTPLDSGPRLSPGQALRRNDGGRWVTGSALPFAGLVGCVLSNELLDSFPVHRFEIEGGAVREVYVTLSDAAFAETLDEPSTPLLAQRVSQLNLIEGFRGEVNPGIAPWAAEVVRALDRGFVLTIDYGYEAGEFYSEKRPRGTLQTYLRHTQGADPYRSVGRQDLTAHVDFSVVLAEGKAAGLRPLALQTQSRFLRSLGLDGWMRRLRAERLPQQEHDANMMAMRDLVRPDGLGGFKVLAQEKGTGVGDRDQLASDSALVSGLPVPLLRPEHIRLLEGRYPHAGWLSERVWLGGDGGGGG